MSDGLFNLRLSNLGSQLRKVPLSVHWHRPNYGESSSFPQSGPLLYLAVLPSKWQYSSMFMRLFSLYLSSTLQRVSIPFARSFMFWMTPAERLVI